MQNNVSSRGKYKSLSLIGSVTWKPTVQGKGAPHLRLAYGQDLTEGMHVIVLPLRILFWSEMVAPPRLRSL
jgi:hypothetical protein